MASDGIIMGEPLNFKLLFSPSPRLVFFGDGHHYRSLFVKDGLIEKVFLAFATQRRTRRNCFVGFKMKILVFSETQTNLVVH
jgi:hypothetical protein